MSDALRLPPPMLYPERLAARESSLDRLATTAVSLAVARGTRRWSAHLGAIVDPVLAHDARLRAMDDQALRNEACAARAALRRRAEPDDATVAHGLAVAREVSARVLGLRPFDEQIAAAVAALRGMAAEMATGEGKTLAATLAAAVASLGGVPVHVVTVNRYLAERDAANMGPLYAFLGLTVGVVTEAVPPSARAARYANDIVVCTNKDVAFDYMRDRLTMGRALSGPRRKIARLADGGGKTVMRGLHFAIVDEADSVLIDEARTPLILSATLEDDRDPQVYVTALEIASGFRPGEHFLLDSRHRRVSLLDRGRRALAGLATRGAPWNLIVERDRLIELALTAHFTLRRDEHYLVRDGRAEIIDEFTGRVMTDRTWNDGLQEMVECREGLSLTAPRATIARTTYQRFYRRYRRLAGMSGTLREVAGELWRVYRLRVVTIPTHSPDRKRYAKPAAFVNEAEKWRAVAADAAKARAAGTPVLIGTRTVAASLRASAALTDAGVPHVVLNAAQDAREAEIVARAGEAATVTVATNMAGRGTDIVPAPDVATRDGLRVIVSEPHESGRIDRQLAGRCGRQGDPGTVARFVSLRDPLLVAHTGGITRAVVARLPARLRAAAIRGLAHVAQRNAERLHARMRTDLLRAEEWLGDATAFAGAEQ